MSPSHETAILAGGCFWGMQDLLRRYPGVVSTRVGYTGGDVPNATYRISALAAPNMINTMPEKTLLAFRDHGKLAGTLPRDGGDCETVLADFWKAGIDLEQLASDLQSNGASPLMNRGKTYSVRSSPSVNGCKPFLIRMSTVAGAPVAFSLVAMRIITSQNWAYLGVLHFSNCENVLRLSLANGTLSARSLFATRASKNSRKSLA